MRFVTPILFLLAAGWVWSHNQTATDSVVTLPFLDSLTADVHQQGQLTVYICLAIGGWLLLWQGIAVLRSDRDRLGG